MRAKIIVKEEAEDLVEKGCLQAVYPTSKVLNGVPRLGPKDTIIILLHGSGKVWYISCINIHRFYLMKHDILQTFFIVPVALFLFCAVMLLHHHPHTN